MSRTLVDVLRKHAERTPERASTTFLRDDHPFEPMGVDGPDTPGCTTLDFGTLHERAMRVAAALSERCKPGERALLMYPPGLDYVTAFFGCLYAGVIAVPHYPPEQARFTRTTARIRHAATDAEVTCVLGDDALQSVRAPLADGCDALARAHWMSTTKLESRPFRVPTITEKTVAFVLYTSGSTRMPRGVVTTHENLVRNLEMQVARFGVDADSVGVSWLPLFHDLGLVMAMLQPVFAGFRSVLMAPTTFLAKPVRWLRAISRYRGTQTYAPNFAYELCIRKIAKRDCEGLRLDSLRIALNGAEPVRPKTLRQFAFTFGPFGFRSEAAYPAYGMTEATCIISGAKPLREPIIQRFSGSALRAGECRVADASERDVKELISNGPVVGDQEVVIVDPKTSDACVDGKVGEVWLRGASVAGGYWNRPEESALTFAARLSERGPFLRTGDLGALVDGEVFLTGRLKDVMVIDGVHHYPQDIEATVEQAHPALRLGCGIVFSVDVDGAERVVVVQEYERRRALEAPTKNPRRRPDPLVDAFGNALPDNLPSAERARSSYPPPLDPEGTIPFVRHAISLEHQLPVHAVVLVKAGSIPKTSSGKVQRQPCKEAYLADKLDVLARWQATPEESALMRPREDEPAPRSLRERVIARLGELLGIRPSEISLKQPFVYYGLTSASAVVLATEVGRWAGRELPPTLLWELPTPDALLDYLEGRETPPPSQARIPVSRAPKKLVLDDLTVVWPGDLRRAGPFKRLVEGMEGRVLLVLEGVEAIKIELVPSFHALCTSSTVRLARVPFPLGLELASFEALGDSRFVSVLAPATCGCGSVEVEVDAAAVREGCLDKCDECGAARVVARMDALRALPWAAMDGDHRAVLRG